MFFGGLLAGMVLMLAIVVFSVVGQDEDDPW